MLINTSHILYKVDKNTRFLTCSGSGASCCSGGVLARFRRRQQIVVLNGVSPQRGRCIGCWPQHL